MGDHNDKLLMASVSSAGNSTHVSVFGGKTIKTVHITMSFSSDRSPIVQLEEVYSLPELKDWVWDMLPLSAEVDLPLSEKIHSRCVAIGFSHNFVEIWDWQNSKKLLEINCKENSILYSLQFALIGDKKKHLIVAAGTVFNEVLLWNATHATGTVLYRLIGHQV